MLPTVQVGDPVHAAQVGSYRAGDVVVFQSAQGEHDMVHRIVFKLPLWPYFIHRGDASSSKVGLARFDRIVGLVPGARRRPALRDIIAGLWLVVYYGRKRLARLIA
jgi:hypothetical protein